MSWYLKVLKNYVNFNGRARRKEYWMFILFNMIFSYAFTFLDMSMGLLSPGTGIGVFSMLYMFALILPSLAVSVRRLHDVGKSGWMLLLMFIPVIGWLWIFILSVSEGESVENKYGLDPKIEL